MKDTSRRVGLAELVPAGGDPRQVKSLVKRLADAHLIVTSRNAVTGEDQVEVAHEALIRHWPRLNRWLREDRHLVLVRDGVREAANEWAVGGKRDGLLAHREERLTAAQELTAQTRVALNELEREYLEVCAAWQRRVRWRQRLMIAGLSLLVVVAAATGYFLRERNKRLRSQAMARLAEDRLSANRGVSQALALSALGIARTPEAETALRQSLGILQVTDVIGGNVGMINKVTYSPDGRRVATCGQWDSVAKVWAASNGESVSTLIGHTDDITSIAFSPDGRLVTTSSKDKTIRVWMTEAGTLVRTIYDMGSVSSVAFSPDPAARHIVSASRDYTAKIWDFDKGTALRTLGESGAVGRYQPVAVYSPRGDEIAASTLSDVKIYNLHDGPTKVIPESNVQSIEYSPDGRRIVTVSMPKPAGLKGSEIQEYAKVWEAKTGALVYAIGDEDYSPSSAAYSRPDGRLVITNARGWEGMRLWNAENGQLVRAIGDPDEEGGTTVAYSPDGRLIAADGNWNAVRMLDSGSGVLVHTLGYGEKLVSIRSVAPSPGGQFIAVARGDMMFKPWIASSDIGIYEDEAHEDSTAEVWDLRSGKLTRSLPHTAQVETVDYSRDGRYIVTSDYDYPAKVWDAASGALLRTLGVRGAGKNYRPFAAYSPKGSFIFATASDGVHIFAPQGGSPSPLRTIRESGVISAACSPDELFILTLKEGESPKVWDNHTGAFVRTFSDGTNYPIGLSYSHDGRYIVTPRRGEATVVWDAHGYTVKYYLNTLTALWAAFSPRDRYIVTINSDHTTAVWSAADGTLVHVMRNEKGDDPGSAAFTQDERFLIVTTLSGRVLIYPMQTDDLIRIACSRISYRFTEDELKSYDVEQLSSNSQCR